MMYTFTQLKDSPDFPAGTVFHCHGIEEKGWNGKDGQWYLYTTPEDTFEHECEVGGFLDDPVWFRKEIDWAALDDLKCPICGETRGVIITKDFRGGDREEGYFNGTEVFFEYVCGHITRQFW